jgi:hypothetical protein
MDGKRPTLAGELAMTAARWNATVVDSPGTEPYTLVGDLVVAVRTPRSRDFVSVEVAPTSQCELSPRSEVRLSPKPYPPMTDQWHGEIHIGHTVHFQLAGRRYRLTLTELSERPEHLPWITCQFSLERD